jgi:hypothetical protein
MYKYVLLNLTEGFVKIRLWWLLTLSLVVCAQAQFDYTATNGTITINRYTGPGGAVVIPDAIENLPVTAIAAAAFSSSANLTSVFVPATVTNIGYEAFVWCSALTNLTVDDLNPAYTSVAGVLLDRNRTTLIQYPQGRAGSYTVPESITSLADEAFYYSRSLTEAVLSNNLLSIGHNAFSMCSNLAKATLPAGLTNLADGAFSYCGNLTSMIVPQGVTHIGDYSFYGCTSLSNVTLGENVVSIGNSALGYCLAITGMTIPNNVTNIGNAAFLSCSNLLAIAIPGKVISIGDMAFARCTSLQRIDIPRSVSALGASVFAECAGLSAISVDPLNPALSSRDGVLFDKAQTILIRYPCAKPGSYAVPDGVTRIGANSCSSCSALFSITMPSSVRSIEGMAFANSTSLRSIYCQGNAPDVGWYAFAYDFLNFEVHYINAIVYYWLGSTGWSSTFGNLPTSLWNAAPQLRIDDLAVQSNHLAFNVSGTSDFAFVIQASTNPAAPVWDAIGTNTLSSGRSSFVDSLMTNCPARLYRLRALP